MANYVLHKQLFAIEIYYIGTAKSLHNYTKASYLKRVSQFARIRR